MGDDARAIDSEPDWPEFRWLERGEGEPVVLLHGLMGRMDHWEETLEILGDGCRAIALSLPILEVDLPESSIEEIGRHVVRFLDAIDVPRAVIGGNSLGGHVALELALSHPDRVSGLVLTGSSGLFERGFTREMIDLGYQDARSRAAEISDFLRLQHPRQQSAAAR